MDTIKCGAKHKFTLREELLKKKIAIEKILVFPSFENIFTLECDATNIEIGIVLSKDNRPIELYSEKITKPEKRY